MIFLKFIFGTKTNQSIYKYKMQNWIRKHRPKVTKKEQEM